MVLPAVIGGIALADWLLGGAILTAASTIWYNNGGKQALNQTANAIANNMSNADEQAPAQLGSGTETASCATGNCPPDPRCKDLNDEIRRRRDKVTERYQAMREDTHNLYRDHFSTSQAHPVWGSWEGHVDQYQGWQRGLRRLLNEARTLGCPKEVDDADKLSSQDPPSQPSPK